MKFHLVVEFKSDLDLFPFTKNFNAPNCKTAFKKAQEMTKKFNEEGTTVIGAKLSYINENFQDIYEVAELRNTAKREWCYMD